MTQHRKMLIGILAGTVLGLLANHFLRVPVPTGPEAAAIPETMVWLDRIVLWVADPIGQIFLRLLRMLVVPLLFSALVLGTWAFRAC